MIDTFKQNFVNKDVYNQLLRLQVPEDETMWVDMGMCFVQIIIIPFILFICLILCSITATFLYVCNMLCISAMSQKVTRMSRRQDIAQAPLQREQ